MNIIKFIILNIVSVSFVIQAIGCAVDEDQDGWSISEGDCDDTNVFVHPNAEEVCDNIDNNCDQQIDLVGQRAVCEVDTDLDGWTVRAGDCNDLDVDIHPDAIEVCDLIDNNCDRLVDFVDGLNICIVDHDLDGWTPGAGDCNDNEAKIHPVAQEICDRIDNNCDTYIDFIGERNVCAVDDDFDGWSVTAGDCNDKDLAIHPDAVEICDQVDNNCDTLIDVVGPLNTCTTDRDQDGWTPNAGDCDDQAIGIHPDAVEVCDLLDNNCDNLIDNTAKACTGFLLEPPVRLTSNKAVRLAVGNNGQRVLATWTTREGVFYRESSDRGLVFSPDDLVAGASRMDGEGHSFLAGSIPMMSSNGGIARVLTATSNFAQTGPITNYLRLYGSEINPLSFLYTHHVSLVTDRCNFRTGLTCSVLDEFDAASSADAAKLGVVLTAYAVDNNQQSEDVWFVRGQVGTNAFDTALNLSQRVKTNASGRDYDPRIAMSADASRVFVLWGALQSSSNVGNLTVSLDGGTSWSAARVEDAWGSSNLTYTAQSAELIIAYADGFYFIQPPISIQITQSRDNGVSFAAPVTVATKYTLDDGTELMPTNPLKVSSSADGEVIAVAYTQEVCTPIYSCRYKRFNVALSVSVDGGASFEPVGVVSRTRARSVNLVDFDVQVRADGGMIFVTSDSEQHTGSVLRRAIRQ